MVRGEICRTSKWSSLFLAYKILNILACFASSQINFASWSENDKELTEPRKFATFVRRMTKLSVSVNLFWRSLPGTAFGLMAFFAASNLPKINQRWNMKYSYVYTSKIRQAFFCWYYTLELAIFGMGLEYHIKNHTYIFCLHSFTTHIGYC